MKTVARATALAPVLWMLLLALALAACREAPPPAAPERGAATATAQGPASASPAASSVAGAASSAPGAVPPAAHRPAAHQVVVQGVLQPGGAVWRFTLQADAPPGDRQMLHVQAIDIQPPDGAGTAQRIDGLDTQTPVIPGVSVLELLDMNFDGYADIRLAEFRAAGPNTPFLNWLFDPASRRFLPSQALNALNAPAFDAASQQVVDRWRDGAARYGTDLYVWRDGELVAANPKHDVGPAPRPGR